MPCSVATKTRLLPSPAWVKSTGRSAIDSAVVGLALPTGPLQLRKRVFGRDGQRPHVDLAAGNNDRHCRQRARLGIGNEQLRSGRRAAKTGADAPL